MITISVCMIVKNEEKVLARCLDSLLCVADEIIIVDTGSTDGTIALAKRYTKNVYRFAWTGSFADARNYAFSKATQEYIYSADADEMLDNENQQRFLRLKQAILPQIEIVQMKYANQLANGSVYNFDEEYRPKLFRRLRVFRWVSPIHETVALYPCVYDSDIIIQHLPAQQNAARDLAAFYKASLAAPLDKRLHHMYATELFLAGQKEDFLRARAYFQSTLTDENRSMDEINEALCVVARAARLDGDKDTFFKTALKCAAGEQPCAEICCEIGEYYYENSDAAEAYIWFSNAANGAPPQVSLRHSGPVAFLRLADCCDVLGKNDEATHLRQLAREWRPPLIES